MSELTKSVFEVYPQRPRAVLLMSGAGTNAEAILSDEELRDLYDFKFIVSDSSSSNAVSIGNHYNVHAQVNHQGKFNGMADREEYFDDLGSLLAKNRINAAIYAGFMKIATRQFCEAFPGVNVHPADLSVAGEDGLAKYRGMRALSKMRDELGVARSTVHVVDTPVDSGSAISLSRHVTVLDSLSDEEVHKLLKPEEHFIYTSTLKLLGRGALLADNTPYDVPEIERMLDV